MAEHDGLEELLEGFQELRSERRLEVPRSARLELREDTAAERMPARHFPSVGRIVDEVIMVLRRVRVHPRTTTTTSCRGTEFSSHLPRREARVHEVANELNSE
jgi:hypothetical protein